MKKSLAAVSFVLAMMGGLGEGVAHPAHREVVLVLVWVLWCVLVKFLTSPALPVARCAAWRYSRTRVRNRRYERGECSRRTAL